jgi:hypothetical protein
MLGGLGCQTPPPPPPPPPEPVAALVQVVAEPTVKPADPAPGSRPYELEWHPRREGRVRLEDFDFLLGWFVRADPGLEAEFGRSRERPLWGDYVGRLRFQGEPGDADRIFIRPNQPMDVAPQFDCVDIWVHGFDPALPPDQVPQGPHLSIQLIDAQGASVDLPLGPINWGGWKLVHFRLSASQADRLVRPCRFAGFMFSGCRSSEPVSFFLDSLSFYREALPPTTYPPRPAPNLALFPGESAGLHAGPERLDFPSDPRTIQPPAAPVAWETEIAAPTVNEILLRSHSTQGAVEYRLDPAAPKEGVAVSWNQRDVGRFLVGGGLQGPAYADARVEVLRHDGDRVHVGYAGGLELEYQIAGTSLIVDIRCRGGQATGFEIGGHQGGVRSHRVRIPGLEFSDGSGPVVGWLDRNAAPGADPLFYSVSFDWTRSHASRWVGRATDRDSFGAVEYLPATDGRRRDVAERLVLTVAPLLDHVLPGIPNPPGGLRERLHSRIWVDSTGPRAYDEETERNDRLIAVGMTDVIQCHLASCWQDGWESCTFRVRAAPGRGGVDSLESFIRRQRARGWLPGLFVNYLNLHPLNQYWDEARLLRSPSRNWIEDIPLHYLVKPPVAVEARMYFRPELEQYYGPFAAFMGGTTDRPPWVFTDYDSRVPGAATLRQAYYCLGEMLMTRSGADRGPVIGESGAEALYAGLFDGYIVRHRQLRWPLLPMFQLQRINPLAAAFGVGPLETPPGDPPNGDDPRDAALDQYLAAQIAYGTLGRLAPDAFGILRQARSYYMMQALQTRYAGRKVQRIAYWNGQFLVNSSEAIAWGALDRSQVYLYYPEQLEVWINGSSDKDWEVRVGRSVWTLPPYGWVASGPDFLEVSVDVEGQRIDYVEAPGFRYFDGRGGRKTFRGISSPTPLVMRRLVLGGKQKLEIVDVTRSGLFGYSALVEPGESMGRVGYLDAGNTPRGVGRFDQTEGLFRPPAGRAALRYMVEIHSSEPGPPLPRPSTELGGDWLRALDTSE